MSHLSGVTWRVSITFTLYIECKSGAEFSTMLVWSNVAQASFESDNMNDVLYTGQLFNLRRCLLKLWLFLNSY